MNSLVIRSARFALYGVRAAVGREPIGAVDRRSVEAYLLVTACGLPGSLAATVLGCTKQNVSKLVKRVEDRRDDPAVERALQAIEQILEGV